MDRFVTVDVETANSWLGSICQIGAALFEDGRLTGQWESLINPNEPFDPINTSIHGINHEHVRNAPSLTDAYAELSDFLGATC